MAYTTEELGRLIARAHYQTWRLDAPPFDLTPEELAAILPNLIRSGSAGIVWHRVKPFREKYGAMAYALEAATHAQIAHNERVEEAVVECVTRLRAYGIEPVLVKGLALAKLYPEGIVRPAGDIDLVVRKEEFAAAHAILHDSTKLSIPIPIDLKHPEIWHENPYQDPFDRLETVWLNGGTIRILGLEDFLRLVATHFLGHAAMRPLWLADIACLQESPSYNDDTILLGADDAQRNWVLTGMELASEQYGAKRVRDQPSVIVPETVTQEMYRNWIADRAKPAKTTAHIVKHPADVVLVFRSRWPESIRATVTLNESLENPHRSRWQIMLYCKLMIDHLRNQFLRQIRSQSHG